MTGNSNDLKIIKEPYDQIWTLSLLELFTNKSNLRVCFYATARFGLSVNRGKNCSTNNSSNVACIDLSPAICQFASMYLETFTTSW